MSMVCFFGVVALRAKDLAHHYSYSRTEHRRVNRHPIPPNTSEIAPVDVFRYEMPPVLVVPFAALVASGVCSPAKTYRDLLAMGGRFEYRGFMCQSMRNLPSQLLTSVVSMGVLFNAQAFLKPYGDSVANFGASLIKSLVTYPLIQAGTLQNKPGVVPVGFFNILRTMDLNALLLGPGFFVKMGASSVNGFLWLGGMDVLNDLVGSESKKPTTAAAISFVASSFANGVTFPLYTLQILRIQSPEKSVLDIFKSMKCPTRELYRGVGSLPFMSLYPTIFVLAKAYFEKKTSSEA